MFYSCAQEESDEVFQIFPSHDVDLRAAVAYMRVEKGGKTVKKSARTPEMDQARGQDDPPAVENFFHTMQFSAQRGERIRRLRIFSVL